MRYTINCLMIEVLTQRFFINSLIAIVMVSLITGALGSFMLWQRLSYLGDSLSHSSLLGIALSLIFRISPSISIMLIAVNNSSIITSLFGDILMLDYGDITLIFFTSIAVALMLILRWNHWLMISINQDLATVEKVNVNLIRLEFLITLAIFIAISAQLIGILLISGFLLIPSASARLVSQTPMQMVIIATLFSVVSGVSGLLLSVNFDISTGPAIILISAIYLLLTCFARNYIRRTRVYRHKI